MYKDKQILKQHQLTKQPSNYETNHVETSKFEHKPLLRFDEFNDEEELEMKEIRCKKIRKQKGKFSEEEKATKTAKKREQNKTKEKVMWEKLNELNKNCKDLKEHKKEEKKKMSALSF